METKQVKRDALRFLGNYALKYSVDGLCRTLKINYINKETVKNLQDKKQNYVAAFWHGTMLIPWYINKNKGFAALTSKSKDGDLLAKQLKHWNYKVVRGSSSKGGDVALEMMIDLAKNGYSVAITPDGPRGPVHKFKAGGVITAKKSGLPLVLVGIGIKSKTELKSWDNFQIPKPFSKVNVVFSDPVHIDRNLDYSQTSAVIEKCEQKLNEIQKLAEDFN